MDQPWEHPDWYDLHDTTWTAGSEREPEHYRELMLALPPLDRNDHLVDVGAGTGKLAALIARSYPSLGQVTLIEPNKQKLTRAHQRLTQLLPNATITALAVALEEGRTLPKDVANIVTIGSILMPIMELRGGTLEAGLQWLRMALGEIACLLRPGGWVYALETLAAPWARGTAAQPVRRLNMLEFSTEFARPGLQSAECVYRFRDRVVLRGRRASD
jgi:SAM-dependent methyltransferase